MLSSQSLKDPHCDKKQELSFNFLKANKLDPHCDDELFGLKSGDTAYNCTFEASVSSSNYSKLDTHKHTKSPPSLSMNF